MTRFILGLSLAAMFSAEAFAFDPQPEPPSNQNQITNQQQNKAAKPSTTKPTGGRAMQDYIAVGLS